VIAILLFIGLLALFGATFWLMWTNYSPCSAAGCPQTYTVFSLVLMFVGEFSLLLGLVVWIASVERHCGMWFRIGYGKKATGVFIRRPGVTSEAAVAAPQRYAPRSRTLGWVFLRVTLAMMLFVLLLFGSQLLAHWLATQ
jgi:hypothetical protein